MIEPGTVWLVGAGPGDPDLLTRKAEKLLQSASVVFHDALVGPGVLDIIPSDVRVVSVGKRSGKHSKDQSAIDHLIVDAAIAGERVVRLKGGDPAVFGRACEEIQACRVAGIDVKICPGVTAASASAAALGTSLTLRGEARKLIIVTAHVKSGDHLDLDWASLADPKATLAIYMGKRAAPHLAERLLAFGLSAETPVALVENASLPGERVFRTTLGLLGIAASTALGTGPGLILVGDVASKELYKLTDERSRNIDLRLSSRESTPKSLLAR